MNELSVHYEHRPMFHGPTLRSKVKVLDNDSTEKTATSLTLSDIAGSDILDYSTHLGSKSSGSSFVSSTSFRKSSNNVDSNSRLNLTRAAKYLLRRSPGTRKKTKSVSQKIASGAPAMAPNESINMSNRIDDMFARSLNRCTADCLQDLRNQRYQQSPIICYESDDEKPASFRNDNDAGIQSRLEAFAVQERLLGGDHPDVKFLSHHIGRTLLKHHSTDELLNKALENSATPIFPRGHFLPQSVHMNVPHNYPLE